MDDRTEIDVQRLIEEHFGGKVVALASANGMAPSTVWRWHQRLDEAARSASGLDVPHVEPTNNATERALYARFTKTTDSAHGQPIAPNVLARDFDTCHDGPHGACVRRAIAACSTS